MCLVFTHSEAGGHPTNEDAFEVRRHPDTSSCWVGSLADGQGGRSGGASRPRLACRIAVEAVLSRPIASLSRAGTWAEALRQADARVLADTEAGFTTLIGFAVVGGQVIGASSGDSALWVAGADGRVVDLTEPVQESADRVGWRGAHAVHRQAFRLVDRAGDVRRGMEVRRPRGHPGGAAGAPGAGVAGRAAGAGASPSERGPTGRLHGRCTSIGRLISAAASVSLEL